MKDLRCIDPEVGKLIGYYETGNLKGSQRERFEIHLVNCTHCFNETFKVQPVIAGLRMKTPAVMTQLSRARAKARPPRPGRLFSLRDSRPWAGLVLIFLVATAVVCLYLLRVRSASSENGAARPRLGPPIQDLSPAGPLAQAPTELRWKAVSQGSRYKVSLYDEAENLVWSQDDILAPRARLPEATRARLRTGGRYVWHVQVLQNPSLRGKAAFTIGAASPLTPR